MEKNTNQQRAKELYDQALGARITDSAKAYSLLCEAIAVLGGAPSSRGTALLEGELHLLAAKIANRINNKQHRKQHQAALEAAAARAGDERLRLWHSITLMEDVYLSGDTAAAREAGLRIVGAASGRYSDIESRAHHGIGGVLIQEANYAEALPHLLRAEQLLLSAPAHDPIQLSGVYTGLGLFYLRYKEYDNSLAALHQARATAEALSDVYQLGTIYSNIGAVYSDMFLRHDAIAWFERSLEANLASGNLEAAGHTLINLGNQWLYVEEYEKSRDCYLRAAELAQQDATPEIIAVYNLHLARLYGTTAAPFYDAETALRHYTAAAETAETAQAQHLLSHIHEKWADFLENTGDFRGALNHYKQQHSIEQAVFSKENTQKIAELQSRHTLELQKNELEVTGRLLEKFLPAEMIPRMKANEKNIADRYESVSVLFADLVGFTALSQKISPETLIELINFTFGHFDDIMEKHGCERVKTIGDGYMAICGAPTRRDDHAERLAAAALALLHDVKLPKSLSQQLPDGGSLGLRVGLHLGPLVCGVVGTGKYQFDVYGDTVNTASRMESNGIEDAVQVTEAFMQHLHRRGCTAFHFYKRREIDIKGKGEMTVYLMKKSNCHRIKSGRKPPKTEAVLQ